MEEFCSTCFQNGPFSLINAGSGLHCLPDLLFSFVLVASSRMLRRYYGVLIISKALLPASLCAFLFVGHEKSPELGI